MVNAEYDFLRYIEIDTLQLTGLKGALDILKINLNKEIKKRIKEQNIYITYSVSPGCIFKPRLDAQETIGNLIIIDKTLTYDLLKFNDHEIAAEILHEIGHCINKPESKGIKETEFYADDFARISGFGIHLKNGFKKYIEFIEKLSSHGILFFRNQIKQDQIVGLFNERINRITLNSPILSNKD